MHVACAAEGEYVKHAAAMLDSLLTHQDGGDVVVHFLHSPELAGEAADGLERTVAGRGATLVPHEIPDERVAGLPVDRYTRAMWYRLFLPELAPDLERILYLD